MSCHLVAFSCDSERDMRAAHRLMLRAEEQSEYFHRIYPWRRECAQGRIMVVSLSHNDDICGWMVYDALRDEYDNECAYVVEIATSSMHRGIGRRLMEYLQDGTYAYITLVPFPEVETFYQHLGFSKFVHPYWIKWVTLHHDRQRQLVRMAFVRQRRAELAAKSREQAALLDAILGEVDPDLHPALVAAFEEEPDVVAYLYEADGVDALEDFLRERSE